ncbi:MAG: PqqD family protein [Terracidiphilus sp.]
MIVDRASETVFALNATAGAAWDACSTPTTLSGVTQNMRRSFGPEVTEEVAEQAILELQERNLVATSGPAMRTRRQVLATLGAVAVPLVVAMTLTEQRAYAGQSQSGSQTPPNQPPHCGIICWILNHL